jgi:hypothetical protein
LTAHPVYHDAGRTHESLRAGRTGGLGTALTDQPPVGRHALALASSACRSPVPARTLSAESPGVGDVLASNRPATCAVRGRRGGLLGVTEAYGAPASRGIRYPMVFQLVSLMGRLVSGR